MTAIAIKELIKYLRSEFTDPVLTDEPMTRHTTWQIGGPAQVLVIPGSPATLVRCLQLAHQYNLPVYIIGNGSNLLVDDAGVDGLVLKTTALDAVRLKGVTVTAQAGVGLPRLLRLASSWSLSGLEFAAGIPATVGGAAVMNAGTNKGNFGSLVQTVTCLERNGESLQLAGNDLSFEYRHSNLTEGGRVVLEVTLQLLPDSKETIDCRMAAQLRNRRQRQPLGLPNAGSIFKNPPQASAGKLIETAGAKGMRRGDAQVSLEHANFIVNLGQATAEDVIGLIHAMQLLVEQCHGIHLEPEVHWLGKMNYPGVSAWKELASLGVNPSGEKSL